MTRTTIESSLKFFGLDQGVSTGSSMTVEVDIPFEFGTPEFAREALLAKLKLDKLVLTAEATAGHISGAEYKQRKHVLLNSERKIKGDQDDTAETG